MAPRKHAQWRPCRLEAGAATEVADYVMDYRRSGRSATTPDEYLAELKIKRTGTDTNPTNHPIQGETVMVVESRTGTSWKSLPSDKRSC